MTFKFVDELPPRESKRGGAKVKHLDFAAALQARPRQWAEHPDQPSAPNYRASLVHRINSGKPAAFRCGNFEAAQRNGVVYVRYNPTPEGA